MEIYNIKILGENTIKKKFKNPFKNSKGLFIRYFDVILDKIYSSNINDIYDCTLRKDDKLIYHFKLDIGYTIANSIKVSVDDFKSFKDFNSLIKFIVGDVLNEPCGTTRIVYKISDTPYSCKVIGSLPIMYLRCYHHGNPIADVELSSRYNRDVRLYDMEAGRYVEQLYTYSLNAFGHIRFHGESKKGEKLLEEKRQEVSNVIYICHTFIQFDPLDYDIV